MNTTHENTGDLIAKVKVQIAPEDYTGKVKTTLKDYAKKVNIKGFRQGKVPVSVVRKMYGKGVLYEELNKLITSELTDYIQREKLPLVGEPLPLTREMDLDATTDIDYEFEFEVGLAPEFSIDYGLAGENKQYDIVIDTETLTKEIDTLRNTYGPMTNPEASEEGDILFGKLSEIDADGNVVEEGYQKMFAMNPDRIPSEDMIKSMANGKKTEDTFNVSLADVLRNDNEVRRFWETNVKNEKIRDITDEQVEDLNGMTFQFEVRKINRIEKMDLGVELYDKAFGEGVVTNEEEFHTRLTDDLSKFFNRESERFYRTKTIKSLIEGIEIPLPDEFLQRWLVQTRDQVSEDNIGDLYDSYARSLKWSLIVGKMQSADSTINVEESDLRAKAGEAVKAQFGSMLQGDDEGRLDTFVDYYLKDEKLSNKMYDELVEEKVFNHIGTKNPAASEEMDAKVFLELLKSED